MFKDCSDELKMKIKALNPNLKEEAFNDNFQVNQDFY